MAPSKRNVSKKSGKKFNPKVKSKYTSNKNYTGVSKKSTAGDKSATKDSSAFGDQPDLMDQDPMHSDQDIGSITPGSDNTSPSVIGTGLLWSDIVRRSPKPITYGINTIVDAAVAKEHVNDVPADNDFPALESRQVLATEIPDTPDKILAEADNIMAKILDIGSSIESPKPVGYYMDGTPYYARGNSPASSEPEKKDFSQIVTESNTTVQTAGDIITSPKIAPIATAYPQYYRNGFSPKETKDKNNFADPKLPMRTNADGTMLYSSISQDVSSPNTTVNNTVGSKSLSGIDASDNNFYLPLSQNVTPPKTTDKNTSVDPKSPSNAKYTLVSQKLSSPNITNKGVFVGPKSPSRVDASGYTLVSRNSSRISTEKNTTSPKSPSRASYISDFPNISSSKIIKDTAGLRLPTSADTSDHNTTGPRFPSRVDTPGYYTPGFRDVPSPKTISRNTVGSKSPIWADSPSFYPPSLHDFSSPRNIARETDSSKSFSRATISNTKSSPILPDTVPQTVVNRNSPPKSATTHDDLYSPIPLNTTSQSTYGPKLPSNPPLSPNTGVQGRSSPLRVNPVFTLSTPTLQDTAGQYLSLRDDSLRPPASQNISSPATGRVSPKQPNPPITPSPRQDDPASIHGDISPYSAKPSAQNSRKRKNPPARATPTVASSRPPRSAAIKAREVIHDVTTGGHRSRSKTVEPVDPPRMEGLVKRPQPSAPSSAKRRKTRQQTQPMPSPPPSTVSRRATRSTAKLMTPGSVGFAPAETETSEELHHPNASPTMQLLQEANVPQANEPISLTRDEEHDLLLREADETLMYLAEDITGNGGLTDEEPVSPADFVGAKYATGAEWAAEPTPLKTSAPSERSLLITIKLRPDLLKNFAAPTVLPDIVQDSRDAVAPAEDLETLEAAENLVNLSIEPFVASPPLPPGLPGAADLGHKCPICSRTLGEFRGIRANNDRQLSDDDIFINHVEMCLTYTGADTDLGESDDTNTASPPSVSEQGFEDDTEDESIEATESHGEGRNSRRVLPYYTTAKLDDPLAVFEALTPISEFTKNFSDPTLTDAGKLAVEESMVFAMYQAQIEYHRLQGWINKRKASNLARAPMSKRGRKGTKIPSRHDPFEPEDTVVYEDKKEAILYSFEYDSDPKKRGQQDPDSQRSSKYTVRGRGLRPTRGKATEPKIAPGYEHLPQASQSMEPKLTRTRNNEPSSARATTTPAPAQATGSSRPTTTTTTTTTTITSGRSTPAPFKRGPGRPRKDGTLPGSKPLAAATSAQVSQHVFKIQFGEHGRESMRGILSREASPKASHPPTPATGSSSIAAIEYTTNLQSKETGARESSRVTGSRGGNGVQTGPRKRGRPRKEDIAAAAAAVPPPLSLPLPAQPNAAQPTTEDAASPSSPSLPKPTMEEEFKAAQNADLGKRKRIRSALVAADDDDIDPDTASPAPKRRRRNDRASTSAGG